MEILTTPGSSGHSFSPLSIAFYHLVALLATYTPWSPPDFLVENNRFQQALYVVAHDHQIANVDFTDRWEYSQEAGDFVRFRDPPRHFLDWMKCTAWEVLHYPRVEEVDRFPLCVYGEHSRLVRIHQDHVDLFKLRGEVLGGYEGDKWFELANHLDEFWKAWELMYAAHGAGDYFYRRQQLHKLREMLGEDNWRKAIMPPVVPAHLLEPHLLTKE